MPANTMFIPNETLVAVLRWLQRFDLDGVQITNKRLRSLVENNEMPLRLLYSVIYFGDTGVGCMKHVLLLEPKGQLKKQCRFDVEGGIQMTQRYLTSTFIRGFDVRDHDVALPNRRLLSAHEQHITRLELFRCNFNVGGGNALEKTLSGCRFGELVDHGTSKFQGWQLNDELLHKLCCDGCALVDFNQNTVGRYAVTDEGILDYCFSSDLGAMKDRGRTLLLEDASVTPELPEKCIQASVESKVTGRVKLEISDLDDEYFADDHFLAAHVENLVHRSERYIRYDFPDQGNGARLLIEFDHRDWACSPDWTMLLRHGNVDDDAFFDAYFEDA